MEEEGNCEGCGKAGKVQIYRDKIMCDECIDTIETWLEEQFKELIRLEKENMDIIKELFTEAQTDTTPEKQYPRWRRKYFFESGHIDTPPEP